MGSIDFALSRKRAASGAARGSCGTAPRPAGLAQAVIEVDGVLRQHNCQPPNTPCDITIASYFHSYRTNSVFAGATLTPNINRSFNARSLRFFGPEACEPTVAGGPCEP